MWFGIVSIGVLQLATIVYLMPTSFNRCPLYLDKSNDFGPSQWRGRGKTHILDLLYPLRHHMTLLLSHLQHHQDPMLSTME